MNDITQIVLNVNKRYEGENLTHYFKLIMNSPNANAPYHNVRHMLHVFWEAYDGGIHMGLSKRELRNLLIAALMHDYNHTGVKGDDQQNIDRAIKGLHDNILTEDFGYLDVIGYYIKATKYPYSEEKFTDNQLILRDADQSQTFSPVWIQSILYGLGKEIELSYKQMLFMQIPFLSNLTFYTIWGQNKFKPLIQTRLSLINQMIKLLE